MPSFGAVWILNSSYDIVWDSSDTVALVDVDLYEDTTTAGGARRLRRVLNIADDIANTGLIRWTVPSSVVPKSTYSIVVAASGQGLALVFNSSPLFTIATVPTGQCPAGFTSTTGQYPNCAPCSKGTFANAGQTSCVACKDPFTTASTGSATEAACAVDKASFLATYNRFSGRLLVRQSIRAINTITVHNCAMLCSFDRTCRSFDFTPRYARFRDYDKQAIQCNSSFPLTSFPSLYYNPHSISTPSQGACELSSDNLNTTLVHYFQSSNGTTDYYERISSCA